MLGASLPLCQLQKDARRDVNAEKKEAQEELDQKREKKERAAQGKGKGRGRGRGRGRKSQEKTLEIEEKVPGKYVDEAATASTEQGMQNLRSQRELEAGYAYMDHQVPFSTKICTRDIQIRMGPSQFNCGRLMEGREKILLLMRRWRTALIRDMILAYLLLCIDWTWTPCDRLSFFHSSCSFDLPLK